VTDILFEDEESEYHSEVEVEEETEEEAEEKTEEEAEEETEEEAEEENNSFLLNYSIDTSSKSKKKASSGRRRG
jgi:hypothetical protein